MPIINVNYIDVCTQITLQPISFELCEDIISLLERHLSEDINQGGIQNKFDSKMPPRQ